MLMLFKKGIMVSLVMAAVFNFVGCGGGSSSDTTASSDSETTSEVISLGVGIASKGPFKEGSVVVAYKLNSDGTRSDTSAKTFTTDNKGNYSFEEGLPWSGPTEFVIYGEYLNENSGKYMVLTEETGLSSVVDLEENKTVKANINIFTDMEADSIKSKMSKGVSLSDAKLESQESIKKIFNISSDVKFEELDLTDGTDNVEANTKLLIISSALLKTVNPEDTLNKLAEDLSDGDLNGVGMAVFDDLKEKVSSVDIKEVATNIEDTLGVSNVPDSASVLNGTLSLDNNISFNDTYDADLESFYISNEVIIDGIYGGSGNISVENGEYSIDGGEFVSTAGSVSNGQRVRIKLLSSNEYSTKTEAKVTIAGATFLYNVVTKTDPDKIDTTPNPFDFGYVKDAEPNTQAESRIVTVSGINRETSVTIENGEYKINNGDWTSQDGTVSNEDNISVRVNAGEIGSQTVSTVTIGGVSGNFSVFSVSIDKTPDSNVSFDDKMDAERNSEIVSDTIIISGINTEVNVSIDNGSFDINESGNFVTEAKLSNATAVRVKLTSASDWEKETIANLKVNNTIFTFKVKTMSDPTITDTAPDEFKFTTLVNQNPSTEVESEAVVISGINTDVSVSVENGEYSINGGDFTSKNGTVSAGDSIVLKQTTASEFNTEKITTLTIGGVSGTFKTVTAEEDKVPDTFIFEAQEGVPLDTDIVSNTVTVTGINTPVDISVEDGEYSINGGDFTSLAGTVKNGDTVTLRHTSASTPVTTKVTFITIGNLTISFSSTTQQIPPIIERTNSTVLTVLQDQNFEFLPTLESDSGDADSWSIDHKPSWLEFDSSTGRLYGTPTNDDVGSYSFTLIASNSAGSDAAVFDIDVENVNDVPIIEPVSNLNIAEDSGRRIVSINVSDIDGDFLSIEANLSNSGIITIDDVNLTTLTFSTVDDAYGDVNITITVNDGELNASTTFGVHVESMPESVSGRVMVDDYVANAKVYVYDDFLRRNLIASGTTDENGSFDIELPSQYDDAVPSLLYIHSVGGTIVGSAMVAPNMDIIASSSYPNNITPLTTLLNDWYFNFYDSYYDFIDAIDAVRSQTHLTDTDVYSDTTTSSDASVAMQNYILNGNFMTSTLSDGNYTMSMLSFDKGDMEDVTISDVEDLESKISTYTFSVTNGVIQGNSDDSISGVVSGTTVVLDINKTDGSFVSIAGSVGLFGSSSGVSSSVDADGTTQKGFFVAQFIPEDITDSQKSIMKENLLLTVNCRKDFVYRIPIGEMTKMGIGSLSDLANEDDTTITLFEDDINITEGDGRLDFADFDTNESRFMLNGNDITSFATRVFNLHDGNSSSDSLQAKIYLIQPIGVRKALVVATDPSSGEIVGIGNSYISTQGALALPDAGIGANGSYKFSIAKVHSGMIGGTRDDMLAEQMIDDPMEINTTMESNTSDYRPVLSALRVQPDSEQNSTNITLLSGSVWGLYNDTNQNDLNDSNDSMHIVQIYQSGAFDGEAIVGGVSDEGEKLKNYPGVFVGSIYVTDLSTNVIFVKNPFMSTLNFVMRPLYVDDTSKLGKILYGTITPPYGEDATLSIEGQNSVNLYNSFDFASGMYHIEGTLNDGTYIDIMWPTGGKKAVYAISDSDNSDANIIEVGEVYLSF